MPNASSVLAASSITARSLSLPIAIQTFNGPRASLFDRAAMASPSSSVVSGAGIVAEGGAGGRLRRSGGSGGSQRLVAGAALEALVAGEAVAVLGEEIGHLFLPGVDEADPLVVGHRAHLDEQADVFPR